MGLNGGMKHLLEGILLGISFYFFGVATFEDARWQEVRRILWWHAGGAGLALLILRRGLDLSVFFELLCFGLLQYLFFSRFYGLADCHGFLSCAIILGSYGGKMASFLIHMLLTILLLGGIQAGRKNINRLGNLKKPVAMLPYLMPAFFLTWAFLLIKNGVS